MANRYDSGFANDRSQGAPRIHDPIQQNVPRRHNCLSLFSGADNLGRGLEQTGRFDMLGWVESSPAACETLRANRDAGRIGSAATRLYDQDITRIDPANVLCDLGLAVGELDCVAGGPPCQAFSTGGRRQSVQDPRGALLWDFLRFVEAMRPKAFIIENVPGLLTSAVRPRPAGRPEEGCPPLAEDERPGSVLRAFVDDLPDDYRTDIFSVNALNYGGPQNRQRIFIVGNRFNRAACFPGPTHGPGLLPYSTLRHALSGLVDDKPMILDFSAKLKRYLDLIPPGRDFRALPPKLRAEVVRSSRGGRTGFLRRLSWDLPSPTILTHPAQRATSCCHPDETRALTARECARIQGFDDEWTFCGSPGAVYRQIGNAVPGGLAGVAGRVVADLLDVIHTRGRAEVEQGRSHAVKIQSCVRFGGRRAG